MKFIGYLRDKMKLFTKFLLILFCLVYLFCDIVAENEIKLHLKDVNIFYNEGIQSIFDLQIKQYEALQQTYTEKTNILQQQLQEVKHKNIKYKYLLVVMFFAGMLTSIVLLPHSCSEE